MTEATNLKPLHDYWQSQIDTVTEADTAFTKDQIADAMLTIAITRIMELGGAQRAAEFLATIAASMYMANGIETENAAAVPPTAMH